MRRMKTNNIAMLRRVAQMAALLPPASLVWADRYRRRHSGTDEALSTEAAASYRTEHGFFGGRHS